MAATEDRSGLGRLSALAGVTCWSMGNIMVARFDMPGLWIGFWRLTIGAVIYGLVLHLGGRRISLATLRLVAPAAIVIACEIGIFFTALRTTTVANATIIGALQPIILLAVASRRYRESVTAWLLGATLVASFMSLLTVALVLLLAADWVLYRRGSVWEDEQRHRIALVLAAPFLLWLLWYLRAYVHYDRFVLVNTFLHEVNVVGEAVITMAQFLSTLIQIVLLLAVPFMISWQLTSLSLLGAGVIAIPFLIAGRISYRFGKRTTSTSNDMYGILQESCATAKVVQGFGNQARNRGMFAEAFDRYRRAMVKGETLNISIPHLYQPLGLVIMMQYLRWCRGAGASPAAK